jgi:hypothetical protein
LTHVKGSGRGDDAADVRAARAATGRILEALGLAAYVFTVEAKETGWVVSVECAAGDAWQVVSLSVDPARLCASLEDERLRQELVAAWRPHLDACVKKR